MRKKLKVLVVSMGKVPPDGYGGIERICHHLCNELSKRGHKVNLLAGAGSQTYSGITAFYEYDKTSLLRRLWNRLVFQIKTARLGYRADIIHTFICWPGYFHWANKTGKPVVYTQQNPIVGNEMHDIIRHNPRYGFLLGISQNQLDHLPDLDPDRSAVIYNCTDCDIIRPVANPARDYLAYLGRLNYNKGIDIAVQIALQTNQKLKIGGVVRDPDAQELFREKVEPYLGDQIEFVGLIQEHEKSEFLGNAKALLMPNRWDEPFGIVMAEALAAGTPIIGTRTGSIPEIVIHGKTGFVYDTFKELCAAVEQVGQLSATDCREDAIRRFSKEVFIDNTLAMYERLINTNLR